MAYPPEFSILMQAIFSGSNPNITSFVNYKGDLFLGGDCGPMVAVPWAHFSSYSLCPKEIEKWMIEYIANVRKQDPDFDGSHVKNLFTGHGSYKLVRENPGIKIKLRLGEQSTYGHYNDPPLLMEDENIRVGCLSTSLGRPLPDHWTFESLTYLILNDAYSYSKRLVRKRVLPFSIGSRT